MTDLTLLTNSPNPASVLPSLSLLQHRVRVLPLDTSSIVRIPDNTIVFFDATDDLASVKSLCTVAQASGLAVPIILVLSEGGCTVINSSWYISDFILEKASPAEVEARLRMLINTAHKTIPRGSFNTGKSHHTFESDDRAGLIYSGDLEVDTNGYTASLHGQPLDLAYKEFELLKYLVMHPGRAFTRTQLLQEVWGYDYYGGTRTVDVHIRRLRAKLGVEYEYLIGTVRNVGYRFDPPEETRESTESAGRESN